MHDQADRFVDDDDVFIFVENVERDGLRFGSGRGVGIDADGFEIDVDAFAAVESLASLNGFAIDFDLTGTDQALQA